MRASQIFKAIVESGKNFGSWDEIMFVEYVKYNFNCSEKTAYKVAKMTGNY